ncbi:MAG: hypothetical protein Q4A84_02580 [Neisseria sp.]|uniref:hypothetical protein n=1 Tax=Neisseria sp. TaxID=192066 RepID=UPI0026DC4F28|nr:hypothetical protein [Neisseria sp.]MDO4640579.1 hypothetical protein [Neisseria sp.]
MQYLLPDKNKPLLYHKAFGSGDFCNNLTSGTKPFQTGIKSAGNRQQTQTNRTRKPFFTAQNLPTQRSRLVICYHTYFNACLKH